MPQNMLLPPSPCDLTRVHLGFSECSQVLSWSRRLWGLATKDDSWELEINSKGSNPYIFRVNLVQPGTCKCFAVQKTAFLNEWNNGHVIELVHDFTGIFHHPPRTAVIDFRWPKAEKGSASGWLSMLCFVKKMVQNCWLILKTKN